MHGSLQPCSSLTACPGLSRHLSAHFSRLSFSRSFVLSCVCSILRESAWQLELKGDVTRQRRLEAVDKLMSVLTLVVAAVFGVQALGLDVNSGGCWLAYWGVRGGAGLGWGSSSTCILMQAKRRRGQH
jgi:hypothetical protein